MTPPTARAGLVLGLVLGCSAAASAAPVRPPRHRTNPQRANRALMLQRLLGPPRPPPDAGAEDGGSLDAGMLDGGSFDAGTPDGGSFDAGTPDGGSFDAGAPDAGAEDAGLEEDAGAGGCDFEFGDCFWWIGANSTATSGVPNSGLRATLSAVDYQPDGGCFDCWTSEYLDNGFWGQVGFSACNLPGDAQLDFTVFYQIWNADAGLLLVDGESSVASEGLHNFSMTLDAGTAWDYAVDGTIFGSYDMGSATASGGYVISTVCEEGDGVAQAFVPPAISVPATMQVMSGGNWASANAGIVYNSAGLSGVDGALQDVALLDDQTTIGGSDAYAAPGTPLWSGLGLPALPPIGIAPLAPPYIAITNPQPNATVSGGVLITADIACPAGSTIYFFASDPNGPQCPGLTAPPYLCSWDTRQTADGPYNVTAYVQDAQGNGSWEDIPVTVDNSGSSSGGSSSGGSGSSSSAPSGSHSSAGPSSSGGSSGGAGSSSSAGVAMPPPGGNPPSSPLISCGCAAGSGTPLAALPLLLLAAWARGRRRHGAGRLR